MMQNLWGREPVLVMAAVQAALAMLVSFGVDLTGDQVAGILGFSAAVVGLIVRQRVSPVVPSVAGSRNGAAGALLLAVGLTVGAASVAAAQDVPTTPEAAEAPALVAGVEPVGILETALRLVEACGAPCLDELTAGADRETTFGLPIRPCRFATVASQGYMVAAAAFATGRGHELTDFLPSSVEPYAHHPLKLVATSGAVLLAQLLVSEALHRKGHTRAADILDCSLAGATAVAAYKMEQLAGVYDAPLLTEGP